LADLISLLNLIAPFFGIIALGYSAARIRPLPDVALGWMQFFLIYVSLPILFYRLIADKPVTELANWRFIFVTTLSTYCLFALAFVAGLFFAKGDMKQSVMQGVAGSYSNIGYMGPPMVISVLGAEAGAPVALIFVFDNLLLFSLIPLLMALAGAAKKSLLATLYDVVRQIVTLPFNIAILLGVLAAYYQLRPPAWIDQMMIWLSGSATPSALLILGVTIAMREARRPSVEVPVLVFVKLVLHPLLLWILLSVFDDFSPTWTFAAMIMAALPPALNIFVIASQYDTGVERASACILVGTVVSMVTLTTLLWLIRTGRLAHDLFPGTMS
jgi:hypothetical protein